MKSKRSINFFIIFFISIIFLDTFKNANASLQDQYRARSCTFDSAPFQETENQTNRYCINKVNNRVTLIFDNEETLLLEGYLGKAELVNYYGTWTIFEWVIDSNKLTQYKCFGNSTGCTDEVFKTIEATKR